MKIEFQLQNSFHPIVLQCVCPCEGIPTIPFIYQKTWYGIFYGQIVVFFTMLKDYSLPFLSHQTYISAFLVNKSKIFKNIVATTNFNLFETNLYRGLSLYYVGSFLDYFQTHTPTMSA